MKLLLFAIASILLTLPNTAFASNFPKCKKNGDAFANCDATSHPGSADKVYCIKSGTGDWTCPTGGTNEGKCTETGGTAVAYKENSFCCKPSDATLGPTTGCDTTDIRWCGTTANGKSCASAKYCYLDKTVSSPKTDCPPTLHDKKSDCEAITGTGEKDLGNNKYCCKKAECSGEAGAATQAPTTQAPPAKEKAKESGAGGMEQTMAGLFTTTTTAALLSLLNP